MQNAPRQLVTTSFRAMNTQIEMQLAIDAVAPGLDERRAAAEADLQAAAARLRQLEALLTRFQPTSELSALNRASGEWFSASAELFEVVRLAAEARAASGGLFDPTILNALEAAGYDRSFDEIGQRELGPLPREAARRSIQQAGARIELDPLRRAIRLEVGARLDLGGIAKGWIVDQIIDGPLHGYTNSLVSAGGDLRLRGGPQPGLAWSVGIRDPRADMPETAGESFPPVAVVMLGHGALATSGTLKRWWLVEGQPRHHLIDPRTGQPAEQAAASQTASERILSATALAPFCWQADILAKLLLLVAPEARASLSPWQMPCAWLLVLEGGRLVPSANLKEYVTALGK
ncbi:MAG TPA: FAD:protein FMN transferase [Ktedonobacterales bacterium]|nr:FAD:protein FMN transferase [Ktedonobacterales bacterium]